MTARFRGTLPALLALLLALPSAAPAQQPRRITGEGTEGFRALLNLKRLQPIESLEDLATQDPNKVLIVAFRGADERGNIKADSLGHLRSHGLNLHGFASRGGALFVATDQETDDLTKQEFDASVIGQTVVATFPSKAYLQRPECPFIVPRENATADLFVGRNGEALTRVATNRPSYLLRGSSLNTLAVFPGASVRPTGREWPEARELPVVQAAVIVPKGGRFMVVADHSIFINSMLLPKAQPNDNLAFASNCVDWLMAGEEPRSHVLFIEDGHIWKRDDFEALRLAMLPGQNPEDVAQFLWENKDLLWKNSDLAEEILGNLEQDGIIEETEKSDILGSILDDNLERWMIAKFVLIVGAIGLFGYSVLAFMGSRYRFPKRVARLSLILDRLRPRAGLLELRLRTGLGRGRYYELARQKAREMFADLKLTPAEEGQLPTVEIDAGWLKRSRVRRNLRQIWAVAFGREPVAITGRQWDKWLKKQDEIEQLIRDGTIRFG